MMTEHTNLAPDGVAASIADSAVALEEVLIKAGEAMPPLQVGDVICCQIRRRHDIFIVRQVEPEVILGSVSRARRINPKDELAAARPMVILRAPNLDQYDKVRDGGIYQLMTGQEIIAQNRRWVDAKNPTTPVVVGAIPRLIARYLPPEVPPVAAPQDATGDGQ